jgi:hypothetical protein
MPLSANFVADFSSFIQQTNDAVLAMQGFRTTADGMGVEVDKGLEATIRKYEEVGRSVRQVGTDAFAAGQTFITAYAEEQDAVNRLNTALAATGQATPAVVAAYSEMASQFQSTSKYADEAIIDTQAVLTTIGKVGPEQMGLALEATMNLASGMKIDLSAAAVMVSKAFASGGENLGKLKTVMGDTIEPGMATSDMLQAINDKFGPAAQNELNTYNGQVANLTNQMSDMQEQIGGVLVGTLTTLFGIFQKLPDGVQTFTIAVVGIGTVLAPVLVSLGSLISILSTTGLGAGIVSAFTAIMTFLGPAGLIVLGVIAVGTVIYKNWDAIVAATQRMYEGVKLWLVDKFTALADMIKAPIQGIVGAFQALYNTVVGHSIVPDLIDGIGDEFSRLDQAMVQPTAAAAAATIEHLAAVAQYSAQVQAIQSENSLFTTTSQRERIGQIPLPGQGGAGGGAPVTVNNTFNLVDTESNLARRVSELIMSTIRSGTQLSQA